MTTAPTASPELPDLDRLEALARAATPGEWLHRIDTGNYGAQHCIKLAGEHGEWVCDCIDNADVKTEGGIAGERNAAFIAAANPAAVLALIALARRAQPEGEAPQAEPFGYFIIEGDDLPYPGAGFVRKLAEGRKYASVTPLYERIAPAAQQAESGAQAEISEQEAFALAVKCGRADNLPFRIPGTSKTHRVECAVLEASDALAFYRAALAAQSQGAQAARIDVKHEFERWASERGESAVYIGDGLYRSRTVTDLSNRLRETADQQPGWKPLLTAAADEIERYYGGMMAWKQTAEKKDRDWQAERMERVNERCAERAQQAAAPGALDEVQIDVAMHAALRELHGPLSFDVPLRAVYDFTHLLAKKLATAASAPGTPEAPADIEKALRELMSIVRIHSDATDENFAWAEMQYAKEVLRAAQLDGGQGEGGKHADQA